MNKIVNPKSLITYGLITGLCQLILYWAYLIFDIPLLYGNHFKLLTFAIWNLGVIGFSLWYLKQNPDFTFRIAFSGVLVITLSSFILERFGYMVTYFAYPESQLQILDGCVQSTKINLEMIRQSQFVDPETLENLPDPETECNLLVQNLFTAKGFFNSLLSYISTYAIYGLFLSALFLLGKKIFKK